MSDHIADTNKMVDTPRMNSVAGHARGIVDAAIFAEGMKLERELNSANDRIQSLIEERDRANRLAEWKWNLRDEFQLLLGTDKIEEGIEAVKELKRHINRLEEAGDAMDKTAEPFVLDTIDEDIPMSDVGEQYEITYDSPPTAGDHVAMDRARKDWRKAKEDKP